jgi:hypothetical protein
MPNLPRSFQERLELLSNIARSRGIVWEPDAKRLPEGDDVAKIGLLAYRLGIPLAVALNMGLIEADLLSFGAARNP